MGVNFVVDLAADFDNGHPLPAATTKLKRAGGYIVILYNIITRDTRIFSGLTAKPRVKFRQI